MENIFYYFGTLLPRQYKTFQNGVNVICFSGLENKFGKLIS